MKKAKLFWIIYFVIIAVVALFFTLFINQGLGGSFSVKNKQGKIAKFNSYMFLDFNKIETSRKSAYDKKVAQYDAKAKKRKEYSNAVKELSKINQMMDSIKNKDKVVQKLKKQIKNTKKSLTAVRKKARRARGAAKKRLAKRIKTLKSKLDKYTKDLNNVDIYISEAKTLAAKIRKQMNQPNLSIEDALLSEKNRLKNVIKNYKRNKTAYEKQLLEIKKYLDKYAIEEILTTETYKKLKATPDINQNYVNIIPKSTVQFLVMSRQVENSIPDSIKLKTIPVLEDMFYNQLASATIESIKTEIKDAEKNVIKISKKIKKEGSTPELKQELKVAKEKVETLNEKLNNKQILVTILESYSDTINKVIDLFRQYTQEVETHTKSEGMPFANFLTQGIYLGNYAKDFPKYGPIVKEQKNKSRMKLTGVHRIEERLEGNRAQVSQVITRKVFGVGEILSFRLAETELDQFVKGFKALMQNVKFQLEQSVGSSSPTIQGTSGGGGVEAGDPTLGGGDPTLGGGDPTLGGGDPTLGGGDPTLGGGDPTLGGADPGGQSSGPAPELSRKEKKSVLKLYERLINIYSHLSAFFTTGGNADISAGTISDASNALKNLMIFFDELKKKHPNVIKQKPIDTSEGGTGAQINIQSKYGIASGKIKAINVFINERVTKLTSVTNTGKWIKRIFVIILAIIGGGLALLTFTWDKKEEQTT